MTRFLWTQTADTGPSPRWRHAMCFDSNRARVVLFGGDGATQGLLGDTWERSPDDWTQVADIGPGARAGHAMCFARQHDAFLFGGMDSRLLLGDTWSWKDQDWTQLDDAGPPVRTRHAMAFDAFNNRVILFGGAGGDRLLNDTWQWDVAAGQWTQVEDTGPKPRQDAAMAYDVTSNRVVLFGGRDQGGALLGDTWILDTSGWTQAAHFGMPATASGAMVGTDAQILALGGQFTGADQNPALHAQTWSFGSRLWTQRQDIGPSPRMGHAMAFDASRRAVVLFGGATALEAPGAGVPVIADTWEHIETDPSLVPSVASIVQNVMGPFAIGVTIDLTYAAPVPLRVSIGWMLAGKFDAAHRGGGLPQGPDVHPLPDLIFEAGVTQKFFSLSIPFSTLNDTVVVFATTSDRKVAILRT